MDGSASYESNPSTNHSSETEVFHENGLIRVRVVTPESSVVVDGWIAGASAPKCQRAAGGPAAGPAALRRRGATPSFFGSG